MLFILFFFQMMEGEEEEEDEEIDDEQMADLREALRAKALKRAQPTNGKGIFLQDNSF